MKFLYHLFIFAVGLGLGVWIGVKFPAQSQQQAAKLQAAVSEARIEVLDHFMKEEPAKVEDTKAEMQQMLKDEQQKFESAKTASTN